MESCMSFVVIFLVVAASCSAIPKDHKNRRFDPDLSDLDHQVDADHNEDFDHEAFLGKEEAHTYDQLSPEESKRRLGILVDKIDTDNDGQVTNEELKKWISDVQRRYITTDSERSWKDHVKTDDDKLEWTSYQKHTYGFTEDADDIGKDHPNYHYKDMIQRDKRRWDRADQDVDHHLNLAEFSNFLHPEDVPHMKDLVVMETMDDIDKDKDGKISLEEYIGDLVGDDSDEDDSEKDPEDSDDKEWIEEEKADFTNNYDKNHDGFLSPEEAMGWLLPEEGDNPGNEADHLIDQADSDGDGKLTKVEILANHELFAGSQATDFGEILQKHDEF